MPRSLISVYNKDGIVDFAKGLASLGWEIISSGGTYRALKGAGITVSTVESVTGFPEMMNGRVKTLHPKIHGGILADRNNTAHIQDADNNKVRMIDMVVVNLYPFEEVVSKPETKPADAIEMIDIGGPSMLRSAAKNHEQVIAVSDPSDYAKVLEGLKKGEVSKEFRKILAVKVFAKTAEYDKKIAEYFGFGSHHPVRFATTPPRAGGALNLNFQKLYDLRYGENPHQKAAFYSEIPPFTKGRLGGVFNETSIATAEILHGKQLSFNNILDADAALNLIKEFVGPAAAVIKHTNPAGCAESSTIDRAYDKAFAGDSRSAFGGITALNRNCTAGIAEKINKVFMEIVLAPDFDALAIDILKQKKNIRLLKMGELRKVPGLKDYRKVVGGMLEQDLDRREVIKKDLKIVTKKKPSAQEMEDMLFAWIIAKHVKSNAIVLVKNKMIVGAGAGQMSRVDSVDIAVKKAGDRVRGAVLCSDAFFPFRDSIDTIAKTGVTAIIQPGGSVKDQEVIDACDEHGLAMVFTGVRAFRH